MALFWGQEHAKIRGLRWGEGKGGNYQGKKMREIINTTTNNLNKEFLDKKRLLNKSQPLLPNRKKLNNKKSIFLI